VTAPGLPATRAVGAAGIAAAACLAAAVAVLTPWQPLPEGAPPVRPDLASAFTAEQVARLDRYREVLGPWGALSVLLGIAVAWLAVWVAARVAGGARRPLFAAAVTALLAQLAVTVSGLPAAGHAERVRREFGLSTSTWGLWWRDQAVSFAIAAVVLTGGIVLSLVAIRRLSRSWPWVLAAAAALLTVLGSAAYPLVVEPAFNEFRPLAAGELRDEIVQLGRADGLGTVEVLVSDASRRTTGRNAHVSGLGATHRVVLDDTTKASAERDRAAVLSIIAHEFGHATAHDVARGTAIGVLGAISGVLAGAWLALRFRVVPPPQGRRAAWSATAAALGVALAVTVPYAAAPVTNLVSRHVEAAADVHALRLTGDPQAFIRSQQALAVSNLSRLRPTWWQTAFFSSHPDPAWRIAQARAWAAAGGTG
jgi:STE24 endopeptidase